MLALFVVRIGKGVLQVVEEGKVAYGGHDELRQQAILVRYNKHIARLFERVAAPGQVLVDFGAGIGTISALMRDRAKPARLICLEIDATNIAKLRDQRFEVAVDPGEVAAGSVDLVFSSNVLEHISDDVGVLKQLYPLLKPGGRIAFWVPAFGFLWTAADDRVGHFRRYSRATLTRAFQDAGFDVDACYYQDSLGFFAALAFKAMGRRDGRVDEAMLHVYENAIFPLSRISDLACSRLFGKNLIITARRPA